MFEKEIEEYERIRKEYQQKIADKMGWQQWMEYNEILLKRANISTRNWRRFYEINLTPHHFGLKGRCAGES